MLGADLIDDFADALLAVDPAGHIRFWSPGAERTFGWSSEQAVGRSFVDLVVPSEYRAAESSRFQQLAPAAELTYDGQRMRRDGTAIHVDGSMRAIIGSDGTTHHIAISEKDVSRLKYMRDANALETRFRGLIDAVPDAILLVNEEGRVVMVNRQALELFGHTRELIIGATVETLVPERFRAAHPGHRNDYAGDPRTRPMGAGLDLAARRADGSEFPAEISLSRVQLGEGVFTTVAIRDVTERRHVEAKFRGLLEAAPDAIVIVDATGHISLVNAQAERMFGYLRVEMIGHPVELLVPSRTRARHHGHRESFVADPRARSMGSDLELHAVRKDGSEFPVEISLSPLETEGGTLVSASIRDVTSRNHTERALKLAYRELESFSYSIAHDLRAPLRGMSGFAQVLLSDYADKLDADGRDCLEEIRGNAVRMGQLIDALLALARLSRSSLRPVPVDLAEYARAAFASVRAERPGRIAELVSPAELPARADPTLARTLIENLVGNAWKFTGRAATARIEVGAAESEGEPTYFVRDNGCGFDMAHAGKLFGAFQRLHAVSEYPGTGIGLATAQRIVHRHGGRIWAEGVVDHGATIWFTFPQHHPE